MDNRSKSDSNTFSDETIANSKHCEIEPIQEFNPDDYYTLSVDMKADLYQNNGVDTSYIRLNQIGVILVVNYYLAKYGIHIKAVSNVSEIIHDLNSPEFQQLKQESTNLRKAYVLTYPTLLNPNYTYYHSVPIFYVKQGQTELFLVLDSMGSLDQASLLKDKCNFLVIANEDKYQTDYYSCHVLALISTLLLCLKDPKTNDYVLPNLIQLIEKNLKYNELEDKLKEISGVQIIAHIKELLKVFQTTTLDLSAVMDVVVQRKFNKNVELTFKDFQQQNPEKIIYNNAVQLSKQIPITGFARQKGLKYRDIIEIQHYITELSAALGKLWTPQVRKEFILGAKQELLKQKNLVADIKNRQGIFKFAIHFLNKHLDPHRTININNETCQSIKIEQNVTTLSGMSIFTNLQSSSVLNTLAPSEQHSTKPNGKETFTNTESIKRSGVTKKRKYYE